MTDTANTFDKAPLQIERQEIRVFAAVMDARGFGRAAEQLGLSQSAVSQAVARLEHKLGAVLLLRNQQPELTEAGLRFMKFARTVICLLYTSPSPRDATLSRMPSSA